MRENGNGKGGTTAEGETSPWAQPGFVVAAALVGLIAVLGVIVALSGGSGSAPAPQAGTASAPPAGAGSSSADTAGSVCGLPAGAQKIPRTGPQATWELRGSLAAPTAPTSFGPGQTTSGVPACFAHSPTGALFAMANLYVVINDVAKHPSDIPNVLRRMAAAGPGRDALNKPGVADGSAPASGGVQIAGFNVVRYETSTAVVDLAYRVDRPGVTGWGHVVATLRWEGGDWKLVLADSGVPYDSVEAMASLDGYVPWSGV